MKHSLFEFGYMEEQRARIHAQRVQFIKSMALALAGGLIGLLVAHC